MRILIAASHRGIVGGTEKYLQILIEGLLARGHQLGFLYQYACGRDQEQIEIPTRDVAAWCLQTLGSVAALKEIAEWRPTVVYSHGLADISFEETLVKQYPVILFRHDYLGSCVSGRKCYRLPRFEPCSRPLGLGCLALYYPRRCGGVNPATMLTLFRYQWRRKRIFSQYQGVLVASRHMFEELRKQGVSGENLHLVPLPATDMKVDEHEPIGKRPGGKILFVGRLADVKGVHYLIRSVAAASKRLPRRLTLTVAGEGPEKASLQGLACRLGIDAEFTGWVGGDRKIELMRKAELLAVPSLWPEPFGLVGIEAGGVGLPSVGYSVGGISDWLVPGLSGELASGHPPTVAGLTDAIVRALSDPAHYHNLCIGSWKVAKRFTIDSHLNLLEGIAFSPHAIASRG